MQSGTYPNRNKGASRRFSFAKLNHFRRAVGTLENRFRNRVFSIDAATLRQLTYWMYARHALADSLLPPSALPHLCALDKAGRRTRSELLSVL